MEDRCSRAVAGDISTAGGKDQAGAIASGPQQSGDAVLVSLRSCITDRAARRWLAPGQPGLLGQGAYVARGMGQRFRAPETLSRPSGDPERQTDGDPNLLIRVLGVQLPCNCPMLRL